MKQGIAWIVLVAAFAMTAGRSKSEAARKSLKVVADEKGYTPVPVTIPAGDAKTYTFQCGMEMFKGCVVAQ